MVGKLENVQ